MGVTLLGSKFHIPNFQPSFNYGTFFEKLKKRANYIIYRNFKPEHIYCQDRHLVVEDGIQLIEMKVNISEPKRWKMEKADHDHIMDNFIPTRN